MIADTNNSFSNSMSSNSNSIVDSYTNSMANSNSNSSSNSSEPDHWKPNDKICIITPELIQQLSKIDNMNDLNKLTILDLHIKDGKKGKIRKIENMIYVPNLKQLNLSYNAITKIENLDRLRRLLELNLAENNIKTIENLDMLTSLTRLNLSGNQIERLPKSISQLRNLTNLRLARNKLYVVKDILYLKPIANLSKLYINDNPFYSMNYNKNVEKITTNSDQVSLYTIFNVQSLLYLNGLEINRGVREEAASYFIDNDTIYLREKLNEVNDQLRELKREINSSKYAKLSERLPTTKLEQLEFDEINKSLAIKLQQANELEEEANSLQIRLHQINQLQEENDIDDYYNSTQKDAKALKHAADDVPRFKSSPPKPHPYPQPSVSERDSYDTNNTSSKSFFSQAVRQSVPSKEDTAAGKQVAILSDRVEKLASKLLTADEEKAALARQLKKQNDEEKSSLLRQVEEERNDLIDKLEVLTEALDKSMKDKDRLLEMNDIITGELESAKHQLLTVAEEKNKLSKDLESKSVEFNSMKEELLRLRHAMVDNGMGSIVAQATGDANSGFTRAEDWRTHEARVEIAGQRVEIDSLKEENKKLKLDLENCMRQITHYSDSSLRSQQESEQLRSKSNYSEEFFKSSKNRIQELEQNNEKLVNQFAQLRNKNISYENENSQLKAAMAIMESEMDAYLRASNFRSKPSVSFGDSVLKSKKSKEHSFFESHSSTDSDSDDVGPIRSNSRSPTTASRVPAEEDGKSFGRSPKTKPTFTVSRLELAAAESMAHMLMEEIEKFGKQEYVADANSGVDSGRSRLLTKMDEFGSNFSGSTKKRYSANQSSTQPPRYALKEACVRAALRIVHTSVNIMREEQESSFSDSPAEESKARASLDKDASYNMMTPSQTPSSSQIHQSDRKKRKKLKNVEILPFHALGSREFLARIVAETQAGLAAIEDSDNLRIEQQKLQVIIILFQQIV